VKYAVFFLACSVGLVAIAFPWTASSVLELWGSLAVGLVGLGYVGVGPRIFGKRSDGRMRPLNVLILAPYLLVLWSVWHLSRALRRESPFHELVEGITIGRRLLPGEFPEGIKSVVDLTAEFPESSSIRQGRDYRAFPILDGSPSTAAALEQIARAIVDMPGDVYIHCAEGHGRTALVATSLLLTRGDARSAGEAIALLLERRPLARMNAAQRKVLDQVAEACLAARSGS
jgi:hypothetical protein